MSPTARATLHRPRQRVFVFDSEALSKAVQGNREMTALIKAAPRLDIPIVTSALTILEAWDPREKSRQALWNWTLSRIRVVHTDDQVIAIARDMLRAAGLHGHKYAIDAVLAAVAGREAVRGAQATVFTSDTDDMSQLLEGHSVRIEKV
ncbi:PIN domain-containing protein [Streptomyces qinzhouensis]|uniref:PIN domain-containing protein n=1 Tax=Streptomyces qinzhouensis TaxID=2599401 RepID=A0A5B8JBF5_9ACTN|nr:PIN domain-containing protein [Streptomyces qinzhouensis]QDY77261.1 PIN domain-containing protein [Streptomyces qinzhouensis]